MDTQKIGERLIALRGDRTQEDIAKAVGVTTSAVGMYERGERIPRDEIKKALASFFGVTVDYLFYAGGE